MYFAASLTAVHGMKAGTSSLVVAAFVGPGTVLTCATAGAQYGYALGWVLVFSVAAVFALQSLTAGTGILAGKGLGEALREAAATPARRGGLYGLVVLGLWVGCAAFETGNLLGAATGLQAVLGPALDVRWLVAGMGLAAGLLLHLDLRRLTQALAALVAGMGALFVATLAVVPVDWPAALAGLLRPALPPGSLVTVVALMGTTIVTYNLFLHASAARRYWAGEPPATAWRRELRGMAFFLPLGGLISVAILLVGAGVEGRAVTSVGHLTDLLEPVAGAAGRYLFGLGLLAAGLTSAVTAPLAAAAGIGELFGWAEDDPRRRRVWGSVLLIGLFFGLTAWSPLRVIIAAQAANGLLLPGIAAFVLYVTARQKHVPLSRGYLAAGLVVTLICAGLGVRTLAWVWAQLAG